MRNIITSLIAGLLVFSVAFSAVKGPVKAPKMVKQQREVEPLPTMQANDRTYWNSPVTHELRNGAFASVVDSSGNGYGMVSSVTNPLDVNDDGNMFVSYRQYAGVGTTHGQLGGAFSEDGEEWDAYYNLNANGNPPWGGGSGVGNGSETTAQARYPSALASGDFPYAIWNEYTGLGVGYGGQIYWTYDQTGWDVGSFMYPEQVDLLWNDFKDLWLPSPSLMFNEDTEEYNAVVSTQDWTRSNNYYFRTETITEDGYMVFGEEQIVIDEPGCLTPGDASGSFNTAAKISTGDNGFGVMGIIGFFPGAADGASEISNYHLPIFKITEDYGQTWHGPSGDPADACDFYSVPNDVLDDMIANFPITTYSDECDGYEYYIVDYWSYYDFDFKIDANGNPHILMSVVPSDDYYVFWIEGAGWYHFTIDVENLNNPGPVNSETGWNYSMVMPMHETWQFNANDGDTNIWQTQASLSFSKDDPDVVWVVADAMNEYVCGTQADDGGTPDDPCDDLYDYTGLSEDIFVVKSVDGGQTWYNPLNATNTVDDPADYPMAWHGDCPTGLLWCGPEENYPHAAHWSTEDEVYYIFQMPNWGFNEIGDLLGPDHMNRVYVGVAEVTDDEEDSYPPDCGDDAPDVDPGDTNFDGTVDVLDIVSIVNHILGSSELTGDSAAAADYNVDGTVDVLDIVAIVNLILGNRDDGATNASFIKEHDRVVLESDGYVGAVQMTLSHGPDVTFELGDAFVSGQHTTDKTSTEIIIVDPRSEVLFTATGDFSIKEELATNTEEYIDSEVVLPTAIALGKAYPNPFNPSTSFSLDVANAGNVSVMVYNVNGRLVDVLHEGHMNSGPHNFTWNAGNVASGMYIVKASSGESSVAQKVLLLK